MAAVSQLIPRLILCALLVSCAHAAGVEGGNNGALSLLKGRKVGRPYVGHALSGRTLTTDAATTSSGQQAAELNVVKLLRWFLGGFGGLLPDQSIVTPEPQPEPAIKPVQWALLVAGSRGYSNYRHQADVCHAYQVLARGGVNPENIVVMMYDDIADHPMNPRPGVIINHPHGSDVYKGVPKDYTGDDVNADNFINILLGNKEALKGVGSGKVIASGPDDLVFVFFSDHGGPGVLGMPAPPFLYANDLNGAILRMKREKKYKEMVLYIEACESGSIFDGLLRANLGVYVTTAANPYESSWGTYCPGMDADVPPEFTTCLGDLYSVAWMEDTDANDIPRETLLQQYKEVRLRTSNNDTFDMGSHVTQYGDIAIDLELVSRYLGKQPSTRELMATDRLFSPSKVRSVLQRDADLVHLQIRAERAAAEGPDALAVAQSELEEAVAARMRVDSLVYALDAVGKEVRSAVGLGEASGESLKIVDWDWDCLKSAVAEYEEACGPLGDYGMRHTPVFARLCDAGLEPEEIGERAAALCTAFGNKGI